MFWRSTFASWASSPRALSIFASARCAASSASASSANADSSAALGVSPLTSGRAGSACASVCDRRPRTSDSVRFDFSKQLARRQRDETRGRDVHLREALRPGGNTVAAVDRSVAGAIPHGGEEGCVLLQVIDRHGLELAASIEHDGRLPAGGALEYRHQG